MDTKRQQRDQRSGRSTGLAEAASRERLGVMFSLPVEAADAAYFLKNAPCNGVLISGVRSETTTKNLPIVTWQRPLRAVRESTPGDRPNALKDIYVQVRRVNVQAHGQAASVHQERRREHVQGVKLPRCPSLRCRVEIVICVKGDLPAVISPVHSLRKTVPLRGEQQVAVSVQRLGWQAWFQEPEQTSASTPQEHSSPFPRISSRKNA